MTRWAELTGNNGKDVVKLIHGQGRDLIVPKPFARDVFLFETYIAGTGYIEGILELESKLSIQEKVAFFREPDNPYDKQGIVIKNKNGVKLGYVPKAENIIFSRLMDAGKLLFARISAKQRKEKWVNINIKGFFQE